MMKNGIIISAQGRNSFTPSQIRRLEECMDTTFLSRKQDFGADEFIATVAPFQIVALTRKCIKNINESILARLTALEGLAIFATGYEWVAADYLKTRGIPLCYLPDYSTISVAEHTIGMILTLSRRMHLSHDYSRGLLPEGVSLRGFEIRNKQAGIIGLGRIGLETARLLVPFGAAISYYDPKDLPVTYSKKPFEKVLEESDILIITASKKRDTPPLLTRREIVKMKPGVIIINSARADLVDHNDIIWGIEAKIIRGYAVDDRIACFQDHRCSDYGRVLQTAHTAWYSDEAIERGTEQWVQNITALAIGNYKNLVIEL